MGVILDGWKETQGPLDLLMPWCQPGIDFGLDACICSHEDPHLEPNTVDRANWFAAERRREMARTGAMLRADELRPRRRAKLARRPAAR